MLYIRARNVIMALLVFSHSARGMGVYIVKEGDTLSEIVFRHTSPPPSLYGENGRLAQILALNSNIDNPNFIKAGETIALQKVAIDYGKDSVLKAKNKKPVSDLQTEDRSKNELSPISDKGNTGVFDFGIGFGAKYYSHNQSGALGSANVGALFLNNLSFFTSYDQRNLKVEGEANIYKFRYEVNASGAERHLYGYSLKSYYKNLFFGVSFDQQPLFKNSGDEVEMVAEAIVTPSLGYQWDIELNTKIESRLIVQTSISYLMDSSASDPEVRISKHKGFAGDVKTRLTRRFSTKKRFPTYYYFWSNDIGFRDYERSVKWGTSSGTVESDHLHFNSTIGLKIKF